MMKPRFFQLALAVALGLPTRSHAQYVSTPAPQPIGSECQSAAQTLSAGSLAQADSQYRAAWLILRCPTERGSALSTALSRRAAEPYSDGMASIFLTASRTGGALTKVLELAADQSASSGARVLSLAVLGLYLDPEATKSYSEYQETTPGSACNLAGGHEGEPGAGDLPADYRDRIKTSVAALETSEATPLQIRSAANCVLNLWRRQIGLPGQVLGLDPSKLSLGYQCGKNFLIRNQNAVGAALQYEVVGNPERKATAVVGKPDGAPHAEMIVGADSLATVRLLFDGAVVQTAVGTGSNC